MKMWRNLGIVVWLMCLVGLAGLLKAQDTTLLAEKMPVYPGGQAAMLQVLYDNLQYPASARENGVEGVVVIGFVIEKDGQLSDFQVTRSAAPILDQEALRVMQLLAPFEPGYQKGEPVRVQMNVPVTFSLASTPSPRATDAEIAQWLDIIDWRYDFYLGGGYFGIDSPQFTPGGQVDVGMQISRGPYWAGYGFHWRFNRIGEAFELNGLWAKDRSAGFVSPQLVVGYNLYTQKDWRISPFAGGILHWLLPMRVEDQDPEGLQAFSIGPKLGLLIDHPFRYRAIANGQLSHQLLRLQLSYERYSFSPEIQGTIWSIGLSWGISLYSPPRQNL